MKNVIASLVVLLAFGSFAHAQENTQQVSPSNELNNENSVTNSQRPPLQGTIILRIDNKTHEMQMLTVDGQQAKTQDEAHDIALKGEFKAIPKDKISKKELDKDAATSTWGWYYPRGYGWGYRPVYGWGGGYYGGYWPVYNYYGAYYNPWYTWNYGPYSYCYYGYNWW